MPWVVVGFGRGSQIDDLVIDLRNNGGGVLQGAVDTASLFMTPGNHDSYLFCSDDDCEVLTISWNHRKDHCICCGERWFARSQTDCGEHIDIC